MTKKNGGLFIALVGIFFLLGISNFSAHAKPSKEAIKPGMTMPQFTLDLSEQKWAKEYLGQKGIKPFSLSEIPAKLILLDVLSST